MPKFLADALRVHLDEYGIDGGRVFNAPEGGPVRPNNFRDRYWLPAIKETGLASPRPRIHDLRHTAVSFAILVGAHPKEIQARAGHSNFTTTMDVYGKLFPGQDEVLAERLDALRAAGMPADTTVVDLRRNDAL